jgi:hypothetical protein
VEDHVHILCRLSKTLCIAELVRESKRESSRWIKSEARTLGRFAWQSGYGAFSVSPSHVEPLKEYIADQERHHRRETFQDEFRRLLRKYGLECDERYVWTDLIKPLQGFVSMAPRSTQGGAALTLGCVV